ncbi:MAG: carbamoyltransferase C-terminal domain-containing protein, partial [Bacteroidota bacterium]
PEEALLNIHADLALAIQRFTEKAVLRLATELKRITGLKQICLAGGVALNGVANGKLLKSGLFDALFVQPAAGDAGGALGAALAAHHLHFAGAKPPIAAADGMSGALLGPAFSKDQCKRAILRAGLEARYFSNFAELTEEVAAAIVDGAIVGWFQGRMEFGPRALGNRSILGDPRSEQMQSRINLSIKRRESFRPFAPVVLEEEAPAYFDLPGKSPYMNLVGQVKKAKLHSVPIDYPAWPIPDKLAFVKSVFPAITHVDFSARIQTVNRESNFRLWNLIHTFKAKTGCGMLINTSFNGKDEPIVCTPVDAIQCFQNTEMDLLVLGDYVIRKKK